MRCRAGEAQADDGPGRDKVLRTRLSLLLISHAQQRLVALR